MKIALALEHFDPMHGGAERYACALAAWLVERGCTIEIFCRRYAPEQAARFTIYRLADRRGWGESSQTCFARELAAALEGREFDVVHGFNHVRPADIMMLHGGAHRAFERANAASAPTRWGRVMKRFFYRVAPKYSALRRNELAQFSDPHAFFLGVSEKVAADMRRLYPAAAERISVVRLGIDGSRFSPDRRAALREESRAALGFSSADRVLLFMAHNYRLKGLWDLLDAMVEVTRSDPGIRLLVVGRGKSGRYRVRAKVLGVADHVCFAGPMREPMRGYAAADALVHPTYYDACATVCLEAMACGLPVATSRNNGASAYLEDGVGGVLFEMPCTRGVLGRALTRVLTDEIRVAALRDNPERIRPWTPERSFSEVLACYGRRSSATSVD